MNKKLLVLFLVFSFVLAGCQQVPEETEENTEIEGAISVQPLENDSMSTEADNEEELEIDNKTEEEGSTTVIVKVPAPTPEPEEPKVDPKFCESDKDCVAISNPNNECYKEYFNKNATEAIAEYRSQEGMMVQDCPEFGGPVCINNKCTGSK